MVYAARLSPAQEPGEEEETPPFVPAQFRSTKPSVPRDKQPGRGYGVLRFDPNRRQANVEVPFQNIDLKEVNMFHLHGGRPGVLGPILVDFALKGNLADGTFAVPLTDAHLAQTLRYDRVRGPSGLS